MPLLPLPHLFDIYVHQIKGRRRGEGRDSRRRGRVRERRQNVKKDETGYSKRRSAALLK